MAELRQLARLLNGLGDRAQYWTLSPVLVASLSALSLVIIIGVGCSAGTQRRLPPTSSTTPLVGAVPHSTQEEINRSIAASVIKRPASSADYRIGPEDLLQITLFNIPEADARVTPRSLSVRVSQQAMILLPLLGEVAVKDMTIAGLVQLLRDRYVKYIRNPEIGVLVMEYRQRASVIGAVHKPGAYELTGPKSLLDLLATAGGVTKEAGSQVHIYREGDEGRQSHVIDLFAVASNAELITPSSAESVNMPIKGGDVINVPQAGTFFVDGAVRTPGAFPLGRRYTLSQALGTAGGVNSEIAKPSDITIYRRRGRTEIDSIPADLGKILAGNDVDPQIEPDDIIVVPTNMTKVIFKQLVGQFVGNFLTGVSIGTFVKGPQ